MCVYSELLPRIPNDGESHLWVGLGLLFPQFLGLLEISELLGETRQLLAEVQWEWQANDGEWREYAPTENRMIEVGVAIFANII